jgi:triosephosphate isomerase
MILLVGNWKMAPNKSTEAINLAKKIALSSKTYKKSINTVVCAPYIHLPALVKNIKTGISFGGQNVAFSEEVAQTGLINSSMLKSYGASYCIVGHSEVRARGETDEQILSSTVSLLQKNIIPVVCVGEKERDNHGWYLSSVKEQVEKVFLGVPKNQIKKIVLAYEPVWAIGKNAAREATVAESREMIMFIRKVIADITDEKTAKNINILYGGSVNEENASAFILEGGAQGLLVGRVSLDAKRFASLMKSLSMIA